MIHLWLSIINLRDPIADVLITVSPPFFRLCLHAIHRFVLCNLHKSPSYLLMQLHLEILLLHTLVVVVAPPAPLSTRILSSIFHLQVLLCLSFLMKKRSVLSFLTWPQRGKLLTYVTVRPTIYKQIKRRCGYNQWLLSRIACLFQTTSASERSMFWSLITFFVSIQYQFIVYSTTVNWKFFCNIRRRLESQTFRFHRCFLLINTSFLLPRFPRCHLYSF